MSRRGWLLFAAMGVIWGIPYLLIKVAVRELDPTVVVFARTAVGAVLLLPLAIARGELRPALARWRPLLAYTVAEVALPWIALSEAERRLASSLSGLLVAAVPLVGALLARLAGGHEALGGRRLLGLLVGLVGVGALVGLSIGHSDLTAFAEMAVVIVGYAVGPFILAHRLAGAPALGVVAASLSLTALGYAPAAALQFPDRLPAGRVLAAVAVLAVVCTAVAFLLFFRLIAEVGPVRATVITYVNPAVAVLLGVFFLGEPFTLATGLGFVLVLGGSVLATARAPGGHARENLGATPRPVARVDVTRSPLAGDPPPH